MPASSVDTFFACSLSVLLVSSAMVGLAKVMQPYLGDLSNKNSIEYHKGIAEYLLVNTGTPPDWGRLTGTPTAFGLASETEQPYELDLDKVTRLSSDSIYSITYSEILTALGIRDVALNIEIHTLFEVFIDLVSNQTLELETSYTFQIRTLKSGLPVKTWLKCYLVVEGYCNDSSSSTSSDGDCLINATIPNSKTGAALLAVFAEAKAFPQMQAFGVLSFSHNSETPKPNKTFTQLSPLNHVLNVSFQHQNVNISEAHVFTYNRQSNLSQTSIGDQTEEYGIPRLQDAGPMVAALIGHNGSTSFAEWTAYPQLPVEIGPDFSDLTARSSASALTYLVHINSALCKCIITCRSLQDNA